MQIADQTVSASDAKAASARGVLGGGGRDSIRNVGTLTVTGTVEGTESPLDADAVGILIDPDEGSKKGRARRDRGCEEERVRARGRNRHSATVTNEGSIIVAANATADDAAVPVDVAAHAAGVIGGPDDDLLENTAPTDTAARIEARAVATVTTLGSGLPPPASGTATSAPSGEASSESRSRGGGNGNSGHDDEDPDPPEFGGPTAVTATAVGIAGGGGDDTLANDDVVVADAEASLLAGAFTASFLSLPADAVWNTGATANAAATGLDGGAGDDAITNDGTVTAEADTTVDAASLTLTGVGFAETITSAAATASATGIAADDGEDHVANESELIATSTAVANSVGVGITLAGATLVGTDMKLVAGTTATADATGVDAGAGDDRIDNTGTATTYADARTQVEQVSLSAVGIAVAEAASTATALATGVDAGDGDDHVANDGTLTTTAHALGDGRELAIAALGLSASQAARWDGGTVAQATANGVAGGGGDDTLENDGTLTTLADADTFALTVTATFSKVGTTLINRLTANTISDLSSDATATASAMDGGDGEDYLRNGTDALADVDATSRVIGSEINLGLEGNTIPLLGLVAGALVGTGAANSTATGAGLDGGAGDDHLVNDGTVDVNADADLPQLGISLRVTNGPSVDLDSELHADATAFRGGTGDDVALNRGALIATADTSAASVGVGVTTSGLFSGVSSKAALDSLATGIDAGDGDDRVQSDVSIAASAFANAFALNTTINFGEPSTPPGGGGTTPPGGGGTTPPAGATFGIVRAVSGVETSARAVGIDADGPATEEVTELGIDTGIPLISSAGINNHRTVVTPASGDDSIVNTGTLDIEAQARSVTIAAAIAESKGLTAAKTTTSAAADAVAVLGGGGDDEIVNQGEITNVARANSDTVNFAMSLPTVGRSITTANNGGTHTSARSVGIDADSASAELIEELRLVSNQDNSTEPIDEVAIHSSTSNTRATGDDFVDNDARIDSFARAVTLAADGAVGSRGLALSATDASATAASTAVDGGGGDDTLRNRGELITNAVANTDAAAAAVTLESGIASAMSSGSSAAARAVGISGDGGDESTRTELDMLGSTEHAEIVFFSEAVRDHGDDYIENHGRIDADALAINFEADVGVVVSNGVGATIANSSASAETVAIEAGGGDDKIVNGGVLTSDSFANADSVAVTVTAAGVAAAANALLDGGTRATATSFGIDADGLVATTTTIDAESDFSFDPLHVASRIARETTSSGNDGDDRIRNAGTIDTTARAAAPSIAFAVLTLKGVAGAISTASSLAETTAIRAGGGDDKVGNEARLTATAFANADAGNVTIDPGGVALTADALLRGGTQAAAVATGIETDGGPHESTSNFVLEHRDFSLLFEQVSEDRAAAGDDFLRNSAEVIATANTFVPSVGVTVQGAGVGIAMQTASSESTAAALDAGGGDDIVVNGGRLEATARANADTVNVSVAGTGVALAADGIFNGGTTSIANARGIDADGRDASTTTTLTITRGSVCDDDCPPDDEAPGDGTEITSTTVREFARGDDVVVNTADVEATTFAMSPSIGVAVQTTVGGAIVLTRAVAEADSSAIDVGGGANRVENSGTLTATARANADAISVAVAVGGGAVAGDAVWDGGITASAAASGIEAGGLASETSTLKLSTSTGDEWVTRENESEEDRSADVIYNEGQIDSVAFALVPAVTVAVAPAGVSVAVSTANGESAAAGIETGAGDDRIGNEGAITTTANTFATAINVSVAPAGVALAGDAFWNGGTTATAGVAAIDAGDGDDDVANGGTLTTLARAIAPSLSVPVAVYGVAGATTTATSEAEAFGIAVGKGDDRVVNEDLIDASAVANADSFGVSVNIFGVGVTGNAVWDGGVRSTANAAAIAAGEGRDRVENTASIEAEGDALTISGQVPFTVGGVAAALSTATANSDVAGIDTGDERDRVDNRGAVTANSDATAFAVTGSIGVFGVAVAADAVWDGGTTAEALVAGIDAGADDDRIDNSAAITANSLSRATSAGGSVSVIGVAASVSTATSTARADGIAGGDGKDRIDNSGTVVTATEARATNFGLDIAGGGGAVALETSWEGGTHADADAVGLGGGGGDDEIDNDARVQADATADTDSTSIPVTVVGFAAATSASSAQSRSAGIDGGDARDRIDNGAELAVTSTADAGGISFSVAGAGAAFADTFMNNATRAEAWADGIRGGNDDDAVRLDEGSVIGTTATARNKATNVAVSIVGYAQADATALAAANAVGVTGGAGDDRLRLDGTITTLAVSDSRARAVTVPVLGVGFADVANRTEAVAVGASGDDGEDRIVSRAVIDADATATTVGRTIAVQAGLPTFGDAQTSALARATGIGGGGADDRIVNAESLTATSTADVTASSFGLSVVGGYAANRADSTAESFATAIAGGSGEDVIVNLAVADETLGATGAAASSTATATAIGTTINLVGVNNANTGAHATATVTGIDGGEDESRIVNVGTMTAAASATATESSTAWTLGGVARPTGLATATTNAFGIAGAEARDRLFNHGTVRVTATNALNTSGNSTAVFGVPPTAATIGGTLLAIGMNGAGGDDDLRNRGTLDVTSTSTITANASAWTLGGASSLATPAGGLTVNSDVVGLAGGAGHDRLANWGDVALTATGTGTLTSASWTFAGAAADRGTLASAIRATAIDGGDDDDRIDNHGTIAVTADNALTANGGARALFGGANGGADLGVSAAATGIGGGAGDDDVVNAASITVDALASLATTSLFSTFAGTATATPTTSSTATATGVAGADGRDRIVNAGSIDAAATATITATGGTATRFGDADASTTATATARATGVATGDGDDLFVNKESVTATATALPSETTNAAAGGLFVDGISRANSTTVLDSAGVRLGDGADQSDNHGTVRAVGGATIGVTATSTGTSALGVTLNAESTATATADTASAVGLHGGDGANAITNHGLVTVTIDPTATANAAADGAGLAEGDGVGTASASANAIEAIGLRTGGDDDDIDNFGEIAVDASPSMTTDAVSDADGLDFFTAPRSAANASSLANDTTAAGIEAGAGANRIVNKGQIDVTAAPYAAALQATADYRARNDSSGNPITLSVDSFATSGAEANGTRATGIAAGDGPNFVRNDGDIDVAARPTALASALARGTGWDGDAEALATALANDTQAVGVVLGNGGNLVINNGTITVRAEATVGTAVEAAGGLAEFSEAITITVTERIPVRFGVLRLIVGYIVRTITQTIEENVIDPGEEVEETDTQASAAAIGILTGDGSDTIINHGLIDTATTTAITTTDLGTGIGVTDTVTALGDGIRAGGGNDTVVLKNGSVILGHVRLDDGDDVLAVHGAAFTTGSTFGGAGSDRVEFHGSGEFLGPLLEFESAIKRGHGTFQVGGLSSVAELEVALGTLSLEGNYTMAPDGVFQTFVYSDGDHGRLEATGTIGLGGELRVGTGGGHYVAGTTWEIVAAESLTGSFATVTLPAATPRLTFGLEQSPTSLEVVATDSSFQKFLGPDDAFGTGLATFFDRLTPSATGDVADVVGVLREATDAPALGDALTRLSPAAYNTLTLGAVTSLRRSMDPVRSRAAVLRSNNGSEDALGQPVYLSGSRPTALVEEGRGAVRAWGSAFGYSGGDSATATGYGTFDYDSRGIAAGLDLPVGQRFALGASFTAADASIRMSDALGDVDSYLFSIYGAAFGDNGGYAQGAVAFGSSDGAGVRSLAGLLEARANSAFDAAHRSALFEAGHAFGAGRWRSEAYGALQYVALAEQAFAEEGLGDLAFLVDGRDVTSLTSEVGWRTAREIETRRGTLTPRFNVAWLRELDGRFTSTGRFAGAADTTLTLPGRELAADGVRLGASLDYVGTGERTWSVRSSSERRGSFSDSGLLLQFHSRF